MAEKVSIIIVTYNAMQWLDYCLAPFEGELPRDWRVVVVDNASGDGTVHALQERYPWVELIRSNENLGFGRANNIALRKALADNVDYVFLLNQDARISVDSLRRLIDCQSRHPESLITSPVHLAGGENELDLPFSQYCRPAACPGLFLDALRGELDEIYFSAKGNAAAWLLSRECLERVGGFHPYFYHYGEDDEYVNRVLYRGGKVGVVPGVFATHNRVQTESTRPLDYKFIRKLVKYTDPARKKPGKVAILSLFLPTLLRNIVRRRYNIAFFYVKTMLCMLKDSTEHGEKERRYAEYLR